MENISKEELFQKLFKEVKHMRTAQKLYFSTKEKRFLYSSFDIEKRVDKLLEKIDELQIIEKNIYDKVDNNPEQMMFFA